MQYPNGLENVYSKHCFFAKYLGIESQGMQGKCFHLTDVDVPALHSPGYLLDKK